MNETDRLRDLLEQAAPAHPDLDPTMRAAAVARRGRTARTRDRALVAAAAVAVLAISVPLALHGSTSHEPTPSPAPGQVKPCPTLPVDVTKEMNVLAHGDAVAVRACPAAGEQGEPLPTQPLVGAAAAAFDKDVEALPESGIDHTCMTADLKLRPWSLQVQRSDGTTYLIGSTTQRCEEVAIGSIFRSVDQVLAAFRGNLARQESGMPDLACPAGDRLAEGAPTWNASFDPATATAGVVCYRPDPQGTAEYAGTEGVLDAHQLAAVVDDLVLNLRTGPSDRSCTDSAPQRLIVLADADDDQTALLDQGCIGQFENARGYWTPRSVAQQAIAAALGGAVGQQ